MIVTVIGKLLAITDAFLGYFVTMTGSSAAVANSNCGTCNVVAYNFEMTACGNEIIGRLICLTDVILGLAPQLVGAIFAY